MTLIQLEYLQAVIRQGSFRAAADYVNISQPALSMQIMALEEELGGKLLDRSRKPVSPTALGLLVSAQAAEVLAGAAVIHELARESAGDLSGDLHIGVIPTVAPYLVPLFLGPFTEKYPHLHFRLSEMTTEDILTALKIGSIDAGIISTGLNAPGINEIPLYREALLVYAHPDNPLLAKKFVEQADVPGNQNLWLLKEGHCLRNQTMKLCAKISPEAAIYEAGSIETLRRIVQQQGGITIIPETALLWMNEDELDWVRWFSSPEPQREIGLAVPRLSAKGRQTTALRQSILEVLPAKFIDRQEGNIIKASKAA
ncbi:MAG: LysR substrate-binding domain-containing protein [Bacteroidota bacterium]